MTKRKKTLYSERERRVSDIDPYWARHEILNYVIEFSADHGYSPSVREITAHVGLLSTATTQKYLNELITAGRLERDSKLSRTLRVIV